jgi:hypothetical protein
MPRHPLSGLPRAEALSRSGAAPGSSQARYAADDDFFKNIIYSANWIVYRAFEGGRRNGFAAAGLEETTLPFC